MCRAGTARLAAASPPPAPTIELSRAPGCARSNDDVPAAAAAAAEAVEVEVAEVAEVAEDEIG